MAQNTVTENMDCIYAVISSDENGEIIEVIKNDGGDPNLLVFTNLGHAEFAWEYVRLLMKDNGKKTSLVKYVKQETLGYVK